MLPSGILPLDSVTLAAAFGFRLRKRGATPACVASLMQEPPVQSAPDRPRQAHRPPSSNVDPKTMLFAAIALVAVVGAMYLAIHLVFR